MTTLASWSGDGLTADTTWTGELGTGDTTTPTVTITGTSTAATQNTVVPPGTRNTGMTLKFHQQVNFVGYGKWTKSGAAVAQNSGRVYYRTAAHTGTGHAYPITWYNGTTQIARLRWDGHANAANMYVRLYLDSGAGTLLDTSTVALVVSTWYRIDWRMDSSRNIELRFYDIATSEYTEVSGLTLTGTFDGDIDNIRLGTSAYSSVQQPDTWWDDLLWTDTAEWLGQYGRQNATPTITAPALPVTASPGTTAEGFVSGSNGVTTGAPAMALTANATAKVAGYVTTTAPAVAVTAPTPYLGAQTLASGASYHDAIGDSTSRTFNLFAPNGTAPPSGWPLVVYIHGGSWNGGGRNSMPARILNHLIALDYAVASIDYELTVFNAITNTNTGATHPEPVSDALCALKHIVGTYDINPGRVVVFGTSAGGHIALEAAVTRNDTHAYTWGFTRSGLRQDADPQTNPTFNFDQGSRTGVPDVAGLFLVAGVVDAEWIYTNGWGDSILSETGAASLAVRLYGGQLPNNSYNVATAAGELNLDSLITGETGTVYSGYAHTPDFPIAYVTATNDVVVPAAAGITPLVSALTTMSYDVSSAVGTVNPNGGLTRFEESGATADEHDEVELHFDLQNLTDWLDGLGFVDASITTTAPTVALTVPTPAAKVTGRVTTTAPALTVTQTPLGWVQVDGRKTITAPTVAVAAVVPVPHVGKNVTTTAPRLTAAIGTVTGKGGVVKVATAQGIQTTVPAPGVRIGKNVTTTAPRLTVAAGASTGKAGKLAYTTAPTLGLHAVGTAKSSVTVTTTAPALALGPGTSTGSSGRQVTAQAPAMIAAVAMAFTVSRGGGKVTSAPGVPFTVPTPQASSSTASALLFRAPRSSRRPDFTRATRRESTE